AQHAGILLHADSIDALLDTMAAYQPHETIFAMKAARL
ncbi:MAG: TIGR00730 family Rossman fold protein, partial [Sphingobium sp.]|nr:TIGR00730 family Rossman fold protein [Sphingobium sp.]